MPLIKFKTKSTSQEKKEQIQSLIAQEALPTHTLPPAYLGGSFFKKSLLKIKHTYFEKAKPQSEDLIIFAHQMFILTKSNTSLIRALRMLSETTENKSFGKALSEVVTEIESGNTFSQSLSKQATIFPSFMVEMIEVGEKNKDLNSAFLQIKHYLEAERNMTRRINSALKYPLMLAGALLLSMGIINMAVIPTFRNFFAGLETQLPFATQLLITCSDFIMNHERLIVFLAFIMSAGIILLTMFYKGKRGWAYLKLKIPYVGPMIQKALFARFCRMFAQTLSSSNSVPDALSLCAKAIDNSYLSDKILEWSKRVKEGETLFNAAKNIKCFQPFALQMLLIAQETQETPKLMMDAAHIYEQEVDSCLKTLAEKIEPLFIVIISIIVLILALGLFLPLWEVSTAVIKSTGS